MIWRAKLQTFLDYACFCQIEERGDKMTSSAAALVDSFVHRIRKFWRTIRIGSAGSVIRVCSVVDDFRTQAHCDGCRIGKQQAIAKRYIRINRSFTTKLFQLISIAFVLDFLVRRHEKRTITQAIYLAEIRFIMCNAVEICYIISGFQLSPVLLPVINCESQDIFCSTFLDCHSQAGCRINASR